MFWQGSQYRGRVYHNWPNQRRMVKKRNVLRKLKFCLQIRIETLQMSHVIFKVLPKMGEACTAKYKQLEVEDQ